MAVRLHPSWLPLVGENVEVRRGDAVVRKGKVDAVTADDQILWLSGEGVDPRTMFERRSGFEVWLNYRWES